MQFGYICQLLPARLSTWCSTTYSDTLYRLEYQQFVDAMSYANDEDTISFDRAVESLEAMIALFET